ncbi:MAG: hypothetical protein ACRDJE_13115 [Dehalococcoidia bacterium]
MTNGRPVISPHFPYLRVTLVIQGQTFEFDALLDTGFDGYAALPLGLVSADTPVDEVAVWRMADGRRVEAPMYRAQIHIASMEVSDGVVTVLGDEPIVGLALVRHFLVTLDHGRRVIVEP